MKISRRTALKIVSQAPVAAALVWTPVEAERAAEQAKQSRQRGTAFKPKFFSAHEYATVAVLADLIIPKDDRSGSATDAGVPEFMDFMMIDQPNRQTAMHGGLAWIDLECQDRYDKVFLDCTPGQRTAVLDDIAWPQKARPEL